MNDESPNLTRNHFREFRILNFVPIGAMRGACVDEEDDVVWSLWMTAAMGNIK